MKFLLVLAVLGVLAARGAHAMDDGSVYHEWYDREGVTDTAATGVFLTDAAQKYGAVCLDGTPPAYYIRPGNGTGASKWYIHMQGGGWCESMENCYERSQGSLGSSKSYPKTADLGGGYFSQDPAVNPMMYNWNAVFMRYCDGASFSGDNATVAVYNGHKLFYRGKRILHAMLDDLIQNHGLMSASDVVVSGCSAGGLATFLHADHYRTLLSKSFVVALPDSGFFLDYESPIKKYHSSMIWVFEQNNSTSGINQACIAGHMATKDTWKCIFAQHVSPFIQTPTFPLQAEYDAWQIPNDLDNNDPAVINQWGANLTTLVRANLLQGRKNGIFLDSCRHHCGMWGDIRINGDLQAGAFQKWFNYVKGGASGSSTPYWYIQGKAYPCDACCKPNQ